MAHAAESPANYQSNPGQYLEDHPDAITDKNVAHELAITTDYWETRAASLRLGLRAIMGNTIRRDEKGERFIVVFDDLEVRPGISHDMYEALMEDSYYGENQYPLELSGGAGANVFSVENALNAINEVNTNASDMYTEGQLLLEELEATKR